MGIVSLHAQNIGISNDAAFTTPQSPLHIYWTADGNLLQLSRSSAANTGLLFSVSVNDYSIFNKQNGALIFGTNATEWMRILNTGNLGIGTNSPNVKLDINGDLALREGTALSLSNGANNDIAIGRNSFYRITGPTAVFTITGLSGGYDGKMVTLYNTTGQQLTIANQNTSSAAANRIITTTGADVVTPVNTSVVQFQYNATLSRWIIVGGQNIGAFPAGTSWGISGNAGTTAGTNYIGTSDVQALDFRTNGTVRARILSTGNVGIGTTAPASLLHVNGTAQFGFASTTTGSQIWNNSSNANTVTINSGATSANYTLTLPIAQGAAKTFLQNDGSGNLSWYSLGGVHETVYRGGTNNGSNNAQAAGNYSIAGYTNSTTGIYYELGDYWGAFTSLNNYAELKMPKCVVTSIRVFLGANSTAGATQTFYIVNATTSTSTAFAPAIASGAATGVYDLTGTATFADGDLLAIKNVGSANAGALYIWRIEIVYYLIP
jgi:hypothetical protein